MSTMTTLDKAIRLFNDAGDQSCRGFSCEGPSIYANIPFNDSVCPSYIICCRRLTSKRERYNEALKYLEKQYYESH